MQRIIARPDEFAAKLKTLREGGARNVHVIADFDSTLTAQESYTSWSVMKRSKDLSDSFQALSSELFMKYHPVEIDETRSLAERAAAMEEWWDAAHGALLRENLTKDSFRRMVNDEAGLFFRQKTHELIDMCKDKTIPFLIFSAGLGDLIDACVERERWGDSVHVISNHLQFDGANGVASRFRHANIHTFSKREAILTDLHEEWAEQVTGDGHRRNVIVIGDSVGDVHMASGVPHDCVLKIGFLNKGRASSLEEFKEAFDVVLQEDDTFDYLIEVLQQLN